MPMVDHKLNQLATRAGCSRAFESAAFRVDRYRDRSTSSISAVKFEPHRALPVLFRPWPSRCIDRCMTDPGRIAIARAVRPVIPTPRSIATSNDDGFPSGRITSYRRPSALSASSAPVRPLAVTDLPLDYHRSDLRSEGKWKLAILVSAVLDAIIASSRPQWSGPSRTSMLCLIQADSYVLQPIGSIRKPDPIWEKDRLLLQRRTRSPYLII
jgi:hypothetical protein